MITNSLTLVTVSERGVVVTMKRYGRVVYRLRCELTFGGSVPDRDLGHV
jgi:hypothetical protein